MPGDEFSAPVAESAAMETSMDAESFDRPHHRGGRFNEYRSSNFPQRNHNNPHHNRPFHHHHQNRSYNNNYQPYDKAARGPRHPRPPYAEEESHQQPSSHRALPPYAEEEESSSSYVKKQSSNNDYYPAQSSRWQEGRGKPYGSFHEESSGYRDTAVPAPPPASSSHYRANQQKDVYYEKENSRQYAPSQSRPTSSQSHPKNVDSQDQASAVGDEPSSSEKPEKTPTLFFGNLAYSISKDELTEVLSAISPVVQISMPFDRVSGQSRGFAFVEFESFDAADLVLNEMYGKELHGRLLRVDWGEPKSRRREHNTESTEQYHQTAPPPPPPEPETTHEVYEKRPYYRPVTAPSDSYIPDDYDRDSRERRDYEPSHQPSSRHESYARSAPYQKPQYHDTYHGQERSYPRPESFRGRSPPPPRVHRPGGMVSAAGGPPRHGYDDYSQRAPPPRYAPEGGYDRPAYGDRQPYPPRQPHYQSQQYSGKPQHYHDNNQRGDTSRFHEGGRYEPKRNHDGGYEAAPYRPKQPYRDDHQRDRMPQTEAASGDAYQERGYQRPYQNYRQPYNNQRGGFRRDNYHRCGARRHYDNREEYQQQRRRSQSPTGDQFVDDKASRQSATAVEEPYSEDQLLSESAAHQNQNDELMEILSPVNDDAPLVIDEQAMDTRPRGDSPDIDN